MISVKMFSIKIFMGVIGLVGASLLLAPAAHTAAACDTLPQDKGRSSQNITVTVPGTYTLWVRMAKQAPDHDSIAVQIDNQCPVTIGDQLSTTGLQWINYRDGNVAVPATVDLTAGTHTVTLAGRETGVAVDKVMFIGNTYCTPVIFGDNCLADTVSTTPSGTQGKATAAPAKPAGPHKLWLAASIGAALGTIAFMISRFIAFERKIRETPVQIGQVVVGGASYTELHVFRRLFYFARHHWLMTSIAGIILTLSIVVGFAAASRPYPVFEAESGALFGGAKVAERAEASGGKVLLFEVNPPGTPAAPPLASGGTSTQTSGGTSTQTPTNGGGGGSSTPNNPGGGTSTGPCGTTTSHIADGPDGMGSCWPGASNTGPNASEASMGTYSGSCTITAPNTTIDSKVINCSPLLVGSGASGLVIKNSYVKGGVIQASGSASFTIQDSLIDNGVSYPACSDSSCPAGKYACGDPNNATTECGVGYRNFTILRTEIINTNRAAYCESTCLIQDSYFHGTNLWPDASNAAHASSVRNEQYLTLRHNTLGCDFTGPFANPELGCSADMSGYPDFAPIRNATIDKNLFLSNNVGAGFCVYGGGTGGKPFSSDPNNATYIVFTSNVFQRGANGKCGTYGAVTDFISGRTGNVWTNNKYDNGATVNPE